MTNITKDPQCLVRPPQAYPGISKNYDAFPGSSASRRSASAPDYYDLFLSLDFAERERPAPAAVKVESQEAALRRAAREHLAEYADYGAGWDGENANAIEGACLRNAELLIDKLPLDFLMEAGSDNFSPTPNGTMSVEVGSGRRYFFIDVGNTKILYYYRFDNLIAGLNVAVSFSEDVFQKIAELFSEFNEKSRAAK